jgi:dipeptidase E
MGTIVAIGGGEIAAGETLAIDREIVRLSGKSQPRFLFVPTASGDSAGYVESMRDLYGGRLGCEFSDLCLSDPDLGDAEIRAALEAADIVYVGGGDTRMMMEAWRKRGVDILLREAFERGALMCGLSAGSICWFERGLSDSESFSRADWEYCSIEGLGFLPGMHGPHHDERKAGENYMKAFASIGEPVIAIDNGCAMIVEGNSYRIVRALASRNAYMVSYSGSGVIEKQLPDKGLIREICRPEGDGRR